MLSWGRYTFLYLTMSQGYRTALSVSGQACPSHANKQVWARYQRVASDARIARLLPSCLPDSYVALYELSRMPDELFEAVSCAGILNPKTSVRLLRKVRVTGRVPVKVEVWVNPSQVKGLEQELERVSLAFSEIQ